MGKTKLGNKITKRIVLIGLVVIAVLFITVNALLLAPLREQNLNTLRNTGGQIILQTDYFLRYIKEYAEYTVGNDTFQKALAAFLSNPDSAQEKDKFRLTLNDFAYERSGVRCLTVDINGEIIDSITNVTDADMGVLESDWYKRLVSTPYANKVSPMYLLKRSNFADDYAAAYCKTFGYKDQTFTFTVFFRADEILSASKVLSKESADSFLWAMNGQPFFMQEEADWTQRIADTGIFESQAPEGFIMQAQGDYNFIESSGESDWTLVMHIEAETLRQANLQYFVPILIIVILLMLVIVFTVIPTVTKFTRPIRELEAEMEQVAKGNLDVSVDIHTQDEIGELSKIFNVMINQLKEYISKLLEKEKTEQRMKYSLLISQISPHFIYNTMYTINILARQNRTEDITKINSALIRILQDRLRVNEIQFFDTIEQEVQMVRDYLAIQELRWESDFSVMWHIEEEMMDRQIPKNIIQPLVENALFHGLINEETGKIEGNIDITIQRDGDKICIAVQDDGRGIPTQIIDKILHHKTGSDDTERGKHIGLANIRERLIYLYGNDNCMRIESSPLGGPRIILILDIDRAQ